LGIPTKSNNITSDGFYEFLDRFRRRENMVLEVGETLEERVRHVSGGNAEVDRG
jgi:hypothetical protein